MSGLKFSLLEFNINFKFINFKTLFYPHTPFFQLFSKEVFSLLFKNKSWGRRGHGNWQAVLDTPLCDKVCQ
jgi:hypothetical protein